AGTAPDKSAGATTGESAGSASGKTTSSAASGEAMTSATEVAAAASVSAAALGIAGHAREGKEHDRHYEFRSHKIHFSKNSLRYPGLDQPGGRWFNLRKI